MDADSTVASPMLVPLRQPSRRSSLTSSSSANSRLCNCVVKEIIATERQYVCDLRDLVNGYLAHFRNGGLLTMTEVHDIFGNIEDIYRLNSSFLTDIESCSEDPISMADCFYSRCPEFDVYAAYCTNYPRSQTTLAYALARPAVQEAFRRHQDRLGHSLPVSSYLHKPVQRVLKYPLLLQNLHKYYDGQLDSKRCIEAALRAIREMANHINEAKRASEHAAQAQQLLGSSSDECDGSDYGDLLMKGDFKLQGAKTCRHVFLFNKAVILAKKREVDGEIRYRKAIIKGSDLMLIESIPKEPLCFHLIHYSTPRKLYALQAKSLDEKRAWCIGIKQLIINSLPCTIPDRSKRLLLSTGLDNGIDKASNGEANDLLSPLADGAQPMSSLAAVAAAAAAAAAAPPKQTWLKSPNLLLRSNARQVPDYLERRRRKSSQFRSYIDLSHFVRKHLARRSDSALAHGAYLESRGKQAVGDDVNSGVTNGEDQSPKVALSPSEHSLSNSLYLHWDSCSGLVRSRSFGSLDLESCRRDDAQCTDVSYDDCCSRAIRLAREIAEKGPGELANMPWISHIPQKRRLLNDVTRKSKHRTAFRNRPADDQSCDLSPTASAVSEIEVESYRSSTAMDQEGREWPVLRRDVTLSSDEGYERGAESDFHEMVPLGSVSNRSSGADFSPPSRCSVVSSDTGSSSNEPNAENNDDGDEEADGAHCRFPVGTVSAGIELHQIESSTSKAAATSNNEPASTDACLTPDSGRSALSAAVVSGRGELDLDASAAAQLVGDSIRGAVVDPTNCAASTVSAAMAVDPVSPCGINFSRSVRRGSDRSIAFLRDRTTAVTAMSSQANGVAELQTLENSTGCRPQACGHGDTSGSVALSTHCVTVDQKPMVKLSPPSSRCSQPLGGCNEQQPPPPGQLPNERDDSATKPPPVPVRPSVVRLARQYSTKLKERPALQARRSSANQQHNRQGSREAQQCNENSETRPSTSKHCMASLLEQGGVFHEDCHDKPGRADTPELIGETESASTSCPTKAEHASNGQKVECHKDVLPTIPLRNEPRAGDAVVTPSENVTAGGNNHTDPTDSRCPRSSRHSVSAALRERMRSLERPPVVSRVFTYADVDCQQVDSLRDRIRMLQTNSGAGAAATVAVVDESKRFRELTPPCANTARKSSAATVLAAYTRCQSVPSDTAERRASGLHKPIAAPASSSCGIAAGRTGRKVSRVEDAAIASGHVRNIVQKFQVH